MEDEKKVEELEEELDAEAEDDEDEAVLDEEDEEDESPDAAADEEEETPRKVKITVFATIDKDIDLSKLEGHIKEQLDELAFIEVIEEVNVDLIPEDADLPEDAA